MTRYIRYGALLGAMLVGAGCGDSTTPEESNFLPQPEYIPVSQAPAFTTTLTGVAWDPESFFHQVYFCLGAGPACPMPPYLSEGLPLYLNASVSGAAVQPFDPLLAGPPPANPLVGQPVNSDGMGIWVFPGVPSPHNRPAPYLMFNAGVGSLPPVQIGPPFPKVAESEYLPTLTLRPITINNNSSCTGLEAAQISKKGVLEAVAKHLTATGTPTTVEDFINPGRYAGVFVVWLYEAGNPIQRKAADGITVEHSTGRILSLSWEFPGSLPAADNQATRGFYVTPNAAISDIGLYVVLVPQGADVPPTMSFLFKDSRTDEASLRPWTFPPVTVGFGPGVVNFGGFQMFYPLPPIPPPPAACVFQ
ncbi:hypothetical protein [Hyalangium rubrum]|uniref:Lipoprotein n=1 Tax=Hyalangium rubrum TaxID=3103134 RepID=A0ABU5HC15_9BACT|nr:hypothetical protein [Hyalangium sp. s54d21]MDY7229630.1 hypothetical protein [Hyalangium sp. s54d21]